MAETTTRPATRTGVFTFKHGEVMISFPDIMSPEDVDDTEAYLALVVRQMRRRATLSAPLQSSDEFASGAHGEAGAIGEHATGHPIPQASEDR